MTKELALSLLQAVIINRAIVGKLNVASYH
jgi:hypothetical protein